MRITFISAYPPDKDGIGEYTRRFVESFQRDGHDVEVITPISKHPSNNAVHRIFGPRKRDIKNCLSLVNKTTPDVIHVQYCIALYGLASFSLIRLIKSLKKTSPNTTLIITLHEVRREQERLGILAKYFYKYFLSSFDGLIVHTNSAQQTLLEHYGIKSSKVAVITHPVVDLPHVKSSRGIQKLNNTYGLKGKFVILCFGFIQVDKDIDTAVKALAELVGTSSISNKIRLIIAGDIRPRQGIFKFFERKDIKYLKSIHKMIDEGGLHDHVILTGYVKNSDVADFFNRADIITLPYTSIEQSGVLNMAITAQKPIVASDVGGLGETLRETGILVPPSDSSKIAEAIVNIYHHSNVSKKLLKGYGRIVQANNQTAISRKILNFYKLYGEGS